MKKVISLFLTIMMISTSILCVDLSALASKFDISNRAQWLSQLAKTFEMTVESDNYPDNYFSDLGEDSEYYYDVLLAVEFGVVDIEAGDPVNPEGEITREFASQTLNSCLKFELENSDDENFEYTFTDYEQCEYPKDDQIAVNRGWFELDENSQFCPEQIVTASEIDVMLADAQSTLKADEVDANYNSTYEIKKDVKEIPSTSAFEFVDDSNIIVYDKTINIKKDDTFVIYSNEIPLVYVAENVIVNDNNMVITVAESTENDIITDVDIQDVVDIDANNFIPAEGVDIIEEPATSRMKSKAKLGSIKSEIKLNKKITLPGGNSLNLDVKISDIKLSLKLNAKEEMLTAKIDCNLSVSVDCQFNLKDVGSDFIDPDDLNLGEISIAGVGYIKFQPELNLNGKMTYEQKYNITVGFTKDKTGIHNLSSFNKEKFSFVFEASCKLGVKVGAGLKILTAKVGIYFEIGAMAKATAESSEDENKVSTYCLTLSAYLYVNIGVEYKVDILFFKNSDKIEWQIYKEKNSPVRLYFHFENGKSVDACTVGGKTKTKYVTPTTSQYGSVYEDNISDASNTISAGDFEISTNSDGTATITKYIGSAKNLSIPEYINRYKITRIGSFAFEDCDSLVSVTIPNSVIYISSYAFLNCRCLTSIRIPDGVTSINSYTFHYCSSLKNIKIPDSITSIGVFAFCGCNSLTNITIPNSVTNINEHAFDDCSSLRSITIPDSVTNIGSYAFNNCSLLTNISIPNSVTEMGIGVFRGCSSLTSITIPNSIVSISDETFSYCKSLTNVTIPDSVTRIGAFAFAGCIALTSIKIPNSVTNIDGYAFASCNGLTSIIIPESVINIGSAAFAHCDGFTNVTIPNSVTNIGDFAFEDCSNLISVTISGSVTSIGYRAFSNCISLTNITVDNNNKNYSSPDGILFNKDSTEIIQYPIGNTRTAYIIPNSVINISASAFENCSILTNVKIPNSVTSIGNSAFSGCNSLTSVTLPDSIAIINGYVFKNCSNLTNVTIPYTVLSVGNSAFIGCSDLTDVYYKGAKEQWNNIKMDYGNDSLNNAIIHYNSTQENHHYEFIETIEATCTEDGYIKYICPCGYEKTEIISRLNHNYINGICQNCGDTKEIISLNEIKTVDIINGGEYRYLIFIPETNATYTFYSIGSEDTYGYLYDSDMKEIIKNDDGGEGNNFSITYELEANKTYFFGVKFYSSSKTGSITIALEPAHSHNYIITVHEPTCIEHGYTEYTCEICGESYWSDYTEATYIHTYVNGFCKYCNAKDDDYILPTISLWETKMVNIENGDDSYYFSFTPEADGDYLFSSNSKIDTFASVYDSDMNLICSQMGSGFSLEDHFEANKTYILGCKYFSSENTGQFYVSLTEKIRNISFTPSKEYVLTENTNGEKVYLDENDWFWKYNIPKFNVGDVLTVSYHSGKVVDYVYYDENDCFVSIDDSYIYASKFSNQYNNNWKVGKNNYFFVVYNGFETQVPITIIEKNEHIHFYTTQITEPTCTEKGYTTYTCSCGDSYTDNDVDALGHSFGEWTYNGDAEYISSTNYKNGTQTRICSVCGEEETIEAPNTALLRRRGNALALESSITLTTYITKDVVDYYDEVYAEFSRNGKTEKVYASDKTFKSGSTVYNIFDYAGISPQAMGDDIEIKFYGIKDGVKYWGETYTYSVTTYVTSTLSKSTTTDKLKTMLVDLMYYGEACQIYQNYKTDSLMTNILTDEQKQLRSTGELNLTNIKDSSYTTCENRLVRFGTALRLNNAVEIAIPLNMTNVTLEELTFRVKVGSRDLTYTYSDNPENFEKGKDGYWYFYFDGVYANQMSDEVFVTAYKGNEQVSYTLKYSVESYAATVTDAKLKKVTDAMMRYGNSAKAYSGK